MGVLAAQWSYSGGTVCNVSGAQLSASKVGSSDSFALPKFEMGRVAQKRHVPQPWPTSPTGTVREVETRIESTLYSSSLPWP
jgi:hypothetical protein